MEAVLRRAQNVSLDYQPGFFRANGWLSLNIGSTSRRLYKLGRDDYVALVDRANNEPILLLELGERHYWWFQSRFYIDIDGLSEDEVNALLVTRLQRERQHIANAQATIASGTQPQPSGRKKIPEDVKQLVMVRDGAKCAYCGSTVDIQFDHIIPISLGGSSNPENLQILCGPCNRRKGAGVAIDPRYINPQTTSSATTTPTLPHDQSVPWWQQPGMQS
ncbi:HNH endonuclease [Ferrimicrobium sp.]|uniref:HNH endonuclease n=1 Tax=Ferrimicrobium sp. TaxID=2926050 RepID=UPI0026291F64|nr:HNH endonuclease [Ferrimicrobium sp.]